MNHDHMCDNWLTVLFGNEFILGEMENKCFDREEEREREQKRALRERFSASETSSSVLLLTKSLLTDG